ncbi:carbohydrate binding domain-containing protein [Dactylosporangium siamense]|uniref:Uncharacterized protein n=1 Tax=Dactylosporangium siamense TaxID=685454 RepID=A0A919PQS2_9ACTN|nr:carbohydrate binding domain-containing protein [Dactylosporangium siamense]GIG48002.1 hypothetical protein Dsi01nite_060430 [Dactylosporangium siamense]
MRHRRSSIIGLTLASLVAAAMATAITPGVAHAATTYYVATNGTTSNPGTESQPFATINQFMALAQPGDTVYVRGGTYSIGETYLSASGNANGWITIRNYPGETPVLDGGGSAGVAFYYGEGNQGVGKGSYVVIDGFVIRNYWRSGINIGCCSADGSTDQSVSHVIVRNNVIDRTGQNGITFMQAGDVTVEHNLIGRTGWDAGTGSWSSGINLYAMYGTNNRVDGNVTYHNVDVSSYHTDGNGIILDLTYGNGGVTIQNNVAFENGGSGIQLTHSGNSRIVNNTTYENGKEPTYINGGTGLGFWGSEAMNNEVVSNNVVYQSFGSGLRTDGGFSNSTVSNNTIAGQDGYQDPAFADANDANFQLQGTSPSVDTGTSSNAPGSALVFDQQALTQTTSDQPISWYRWAPDFGYILGRGGVANLFGSVARPQGGGYDRGAFERSGTGVDPGGSGNLISNGEFDNGTTGWWTWFDTAAAGTIGVSAAGLSGANALKLDLSNGASYDWQAQVGQTLPVTAGTQYTLSFRGRADAARSVGVLVQQEGAPYTAYLSGTASLGTSGQTYTFQFTPTASGNAYVKFQAGGSGTDLYLDAISLTS